MLVRIFAALLMAVLLRGAAGVDERRAGADGAISTAHAALAASSSVAEPPVLRAPGQGRAVFVAVAQPAAEPACARPRPVPVAPDARPNRPDVVTRPSQGPPVG